MIGKSGFLYMGIMTLVLGCAGTGINKGDVSLISMDEEWELGANLAVDIAAEKQVVDSPEINAYITAMGQAILAQATADTPIASRPWTFHVVIDEQVNAFNIPGGHVYFNSGLIAQAESYDELMGVMGHEVSHGLARHGVENLTKQYGVALTASIILGSDPQVYQEILAGVLASGAIMSFSRSAEREADQLGIQYMYAADVNPEGMVTFFEKLKELETREPSAIERFFSSHPMTRERIHDAQEQIRSLPEKTFPPEDETGFVAFQTRVAAVVPLAEEDSP